MSARTLEAVQADLASLLPPGWVWPRGANSEMQRLMAAMAAGIVTVEEAAAALETEVDPGLSSMLLEDYERVLGPDPCGRYDLVTTTAERRLIARQRWMARGGASAAYFIGLAAAMGVTATIETDITTQCGFECGDEIVESPEQFVWRMTLPATQEFEAEIGDFEAGDYLGWLVPSLIECVIRRLAPAHTIPVIAYS